MDFSTYEIPFTAEGRRRVHAFSYIVSYSRRQYVRFVESQDFATTIREHVRAFDYLQGSAATCLLDFVPGNKIVSEDVEYSAEIIKGQFMHFQKSLLTGMRISAVKRSRAPMLRRQKICVFRLSPPDRRTSHTSPPDLRDPMRRTAARTSPDGSGRSSVSSPACKRVPYLRPLYLRVLGT
jgi:hypothetical protein